MAIEGEIITRLLADGTVSGIVSTRGYGQRVPQGETVPYFVLRRISEVGFHAHDGPLSDRTVRLQIDSVDDDHADAETLADAIESSLDGFQGTITTRKIGFIKFAGGGPVGYDDGREQHRVVRDYNVGYKET